MQDDQENQSFYGKQTTELPKVMSWILPESDYQSVFFPIPRWGKNKPQALHIKISFTLFLDALK